MRDAITQWEEIYERVLRKTGLSSGSVGSEARIECAKIATKILAVDQSVAMVRESKAP